MKDKTQTGYEESDNSRPRHTPERQEDRDYTRPFGAFIVKMIQQYVIPLTDCMCIIIIGPSIPNLLHCDESFQDEPYGNYGT